MEQGGGGLSVVGWYIAVDRASPEGIHVASWFTTGVIRDGRSLLAVATSDTGSSGAQDETGNLQHKQRRLQYIWYTVVLHSQLARAVILSP